MTVFTDVQFITCHLNAAHWLSVQMDRVDLIKRSDKLSMQKAGQNALHWLTGEQVIEIGHAQTLVPF